MEKSKNKDIKEIYDKLKQMGRSFGKTDRNSNSTNSELSDSEKSDTEQITKSSNESYDADNEIVNEDSDEDIQSEVDYICLNPNSANSIVCRKKHKHYGHRDRMNDRVRIDPEFEGFAPHEMLEFLLYIGIPRVDTNVIAHELIEYFGSFSKVFYASVEELIKVKGMTERAAFTIASVLPIARWVSIQNSKSQQIRLVGTSSAKDYLRPYFENKLIENVYIVCLDSADYIINVFPISKGSNNAALLDCRQIISKANTSMASKVILVHNHPAGTLSPSLEDIAATSRVAAGLSAIYVSLIDHLIFVPSGACYSFYASGTLFEILQGSDEIIGGNTVGEVYSSIDTKDMIKLTRKTSSKFLQGIYENTLSKNNTSGKDLYD